MHTTSMENMQRMISQNKNHLSIYEMLRVTELGSYTEPEHDSYRSLFKDLKTEYTGVDMRAGPNVDLVMTDPYVIPLPDSSQDLVISGQTLEHVEWFWETMRELARILRPGGLMFMIVPMKGGVHRHPVDCWRFYPDSWAALARWSNLELLETHIDTRSQWHDHSAVLRKN